MKKCKISLCLLLSLLLPFSAVACNNTPTPPEGNNNTPTDEVIKPQGPQDYIEADEAGYFKTGDTVTEYTGEDLTVGLDDPYYGGAQFVGKLFTEGLGRAPGANEYLYYIRQLESHGCSQETLADITEQCFSSVSFRELRLAPEYEVLAVYRAVLNRDPTLDEVADYASRVAQEKAAGIAVSLVATEEFAAMIPDIIKGPYYWGENNAKYVPNGTKTMTSSHLNQLLMASAKKSKIVELDPGTVVLVTNNVVVPEGVTLTTKGNPTHYTQQARLIRTKNNNARMVVCQKDATLSHVWVDGNRTAFAEDSLPGGNGAANVALLGDGAKCLNCRTNGSTGGTNLFGGDGVRNLHIANNLVTVYESTHHASWADGITVASTNCLIENNEVVDATDVGIILFRFISSDHSEPQNSIVRNNTILNLGNSAYAGIDIDAWNRQGATQNFTGTLFENNALWTSFKAHQHICLSLATLAWHNVIGDQANGSTVINNYTPEGLQVLCAIVFAADGCHDFIARGNHINAYIGPWGRGDYNEALRERISSINPDTANGDLQGIYEELTTWLPYQPIILGHTAPPLENTPLKGAIFHEDRVTAEEVNHPAG